MLKAEELGDTLQKYSESQWIPARPENWPLTWRLRDAWAVLCGRAHAVEWPSDSEARDA